MYSKFPFSMENIPRQRGFGCLSLKFGCILTALIVILYTLLALFQGCAELMIMAGEPKTDYEAVMGYGFIACIIVINSVSFVLSVVMLLGALKNQAELIKPWVVWQSLQLVVAVFVFVFWNTMNMINQFADTSLLFCAAEFLAILIRFYMLILVTSFYKQLEEDREEMERLRNLIHTDNWYTEA